MNFSIMNFSIPENRGIMIFSVILCIMIQMKKANVTKVTTLA